MYKQLLNGVCQNSHIIPKGKKPEARTELPLQTSVKEAQYSRTTHCALMNIIRHLE